MVDEPRLSRGSSLVDFEDDSPERHDFETTEFFQVEETLLAAAVHEDDSDDEGTVFPLDDSTRSTVDFDYSVDGTTPTATPTAFGGELPKVIEAFFADDDLNLSYISDVSDDSLSPRSGGTPTSCRPHPLESILEEDEDEDDDDDVLSPRDIRLALPRSPPHCKHKGSPALNPLSSSSKMMMMIPLSFEDAFENDDIFTDDPTTSFPAPLRVSLST